MKKVLLAALMLASCFTLATALDPYFQEIRSANKNVGVMAAFLGDSRRLFANHFFDEADAYFHSGVSPGIFAQRPPGGHAHLEGEHGEAEEHEEEARRTRAPHDVIERFGRSFYPTEHSHLGGGHEREMLPWLRLSASLNPQSVPAFLTGAYWLRRMNRPGEAEGFLREGLRANPESCEILMELGRIYEIDKHDFSTARNIFNLALGKWRQHDQRGEKPDPEVCDQIYGEMVRMDKLEENWPRMLSDLEELQKYSPDKESVAKSITALKAQLGR